MVEPLPRCTSGITARCLKMNGIFAVFSSCSRAPSSTGTPSVQSLIGLPPATSSMFIVVLPLLSVAAGLLEPGKPHPALMLTSPFNT
ncbi:hypothetical protein D3C85_1746050 [compost metagenome]